MKELKYIGFSSFIYPSHINSLAKAYNTIPELRDPQLEIGVVAKMEWIQVTPAEIPMY